MSASLTFVGFEHSACHESLLTCFVIILGGLAGHSLGSLVPAMCNCMSSAQLHELP